ncbi:MAG: phosphoribosyltransferase family protein [Ignisphaera sp.]|nr:phosphoribosyltransferase family protein [Ignisphaera sp.]MDW8084735.1 phosphoribosyltransferase family protein [Ignisphaera sp.]
MAGLISIYAFDELWSVSNMVRYGLQALQHRGSGRYTVCSFDGAVKCGAGSSLDEIQQHASGWFSIAGIHSSDSDTAIDVENGGVRIALIVERSYSELESFARSLVKNLTSRGRVDEALTAVVEEHQHQVPSFGAITSRGEAIVYRGLDGLTPMVLGSYGFDMAFASSESVAIEILGGDVRKFLLPGEFVYISKNHMRISRVGCSNCRGRLCIFELLYVARHDAVVDGVSVYGFRKKLGSRLASNFDRKNEVDIVVGVPETAIPYAVGFAESVGKPFELAFVATGGRLRSMLFQNPLEKLIAVHLKMNPVRGVLEGKRVVVVDDSMVTGATMKTVSQILRFRIGVEELHLSIASPPLVGECPHSVMNLDVRSLLSANLSEDVAGKYLEVDSLTWLSLEDVDSVARTFNLCLCAKCFGAEFVGCR